MSQRILGIVVGALVLAHVGLFAYVVAARLTFPFELEWMTGSVLDHVERIAQGHPLYAEPSADFIPFIYPPLYYWIAAKLGGSFLVCRLLSLSAAAIQAACAYRLALLLGAPRGWSLLAVGLFLACFGYVGWWYDIERSDTLFVAMMVSATTLLAWRRTAVTCALAGALVGLGFFAKQPAVAFAIALTFGVALAPGADEKRRWSNAAFFLCAAAAVFLVVGALFRASNPRFYYFLFGVPRSHGILPALLAEVATEDLVHGLVLVAATLLFAWQALRSPRRTGAEIVFTSALLAGAAGALSSRLHIGGWINVLQQWTTFASVACAVLAARADASVSSRMKLASRAAVAVQLLLLVYDPMVRTPARRYANDTRKLHELVAELEQRGEVLFVGRGHVTKHRHFHISALADVVLADGSSPADLRRALEERRFAAILDDGYKRGETPKKLWPAVMLEDIHDLRDLLLANYFVARRIDDAWTDLAMPAPARPCWVFLPRTNVVAGLSHEELVERKLREMTLAEKGTAQDEIEERAAR